MKLVSWNVNGLRACLGKGFLDYCTQENADVICLQETKLQPEQAVFELHGYHRYFYSAEKKGYSGTAILTKQAPLSVRYGLGLDEHDHEGRLITAEYPEFYLVCCYCDVTRSVSKMTEIERRGGKRWDKPKKAEKSRDCGGGKF